MTDEPSNNSEQLDPTFIALIDHGREERNLEYKCSVSWSDNAIKAKLTKATLAMANLRDGGAIVIGMDEANPGIWEPVGMSPEHLDSFSHDDCMVHFNMYADPSVECHVTKFEYDTKHFVVIQISEFQELPIVCKKDGREKLAKGTIYTRPKSKHETAAVPSQTEMREIIEMATEKNLRKLMTMISRSGLSVISSHEKSDQAYEEQLDGL